MKKELITLDHVSFSYGGDRVVDDVSVTIREGDFIGLVGQNGSGKTTLLKLMIGLLKPEEGTLTKVPGEDVGYVPQKVTQGEVQFPITVQEVVLQGRTKRLGMFRPFQEADYAAVERALAAVGMLEKKTRLLRELSGGQQQRVFIARAIVSDPKVLILDEPTVGIDEASQEEFYILLAQLKRERNLTIIIVSHEVEAVMREVSQVLCMNTKLVYHGTPEGFLEGGYATALLGEGKKLIHHEH